MLAKLIGSSSRTTSRSTTISERVVSVLSSARTVDETSTVTASAMDGKTDTRFVNKEGSCNVVFGEDSENRPTRQQGLGTAECDFNCAEQSSNIAERSCNSSRLQGRQSRGELRLHTSTESKYDKENGNQSNGTAT